jgi:hypothetical protein
MKMLLIVGGVLFLLLAFFLFAAAVVVFFMARSKRAQAAGAQPGSKPAAAPVPTYNPPASPVAPRPAAPPPPAAPVASSPVVAVPVKPAPMAPPDADGTVVLDSRKALMFGALHGVGGALAGRILPIDAAGFYIGRDQSLSQVVIDNPSVSKRHVWIGVKDGAVVVADQQSTNGTYLNSDPARVTETRLKPGDVLIISDDVAKLEYRV